MEVSNYEVDETATTNLILEDGNYIEDDIEEVAPKIKNVKTVFSKFLEEKPVVAYKKLVVPQSMRSIYWKFFGFPANEKSAILTRVKIVCLLCKTQIAYNRNTSNLRMHLQNKHSKELYALESHTPPKKQNISAETKEKKAQKKALKEALACSKEHLYTSDVAGTVQISDSNNQIQFVSDPNIRYSDSIEKSVETKNVSGKQRKYILQREDAIDIPATLDSPITFVVTQENHQSPFQNTKSVSDAILEFLIIDLQVPEIVQQQGFQRLIATLKSPCQIPDKNALEENIIPKTYYSFKETILRNISLISNEVSIAIEEWTSNNGENFFTFLIYYQNKIEACLDSKVLSTLHIPKDYDVDQWRETIHDFLQEWNIPNHKITAFVVSSDRIELINALESLQISVIPCLLYSLQTCAQACFETYNIAPVLSKCRNIIGAIDSYSEMSTSFLSQEQCYGLEETGMTIDSPAIWTTTYSMLKQIFLHREILTSFFTKADHRVNLCHLELSEEEWQIISDLLDVLQPLQVTLITLSEEKMPLISLLKPLLWQLVSTHLKVKEEDSTISKSLKESLINMLCNKYADQDVSLLLQISTTLDPRFKNVPYATNEDKKIVALPIKEMLIKIIHDKGESENFTDEQPEKKPRLSRMEFLLGGLNKVHKQDMSTSEKADLELAQYESEPTAPLDSCPIQWWYKSSVKCPNLSNLAGRYNCVPVCCAPPSRIPFDIQIDYHKKRAALPTHLIDKMIFLHANHNLV
ncbi:zinc finger BED domain-containing protein 1-like [Trichogramma pretiosum]|uniref:zinc finger BED domain-containing protein 1-like n=1 Tax=Trichogramma pretiosum TaxID=7493 RepID=UPI0006C9E082|nr:zinc finger BED domain-containing protein 1-like [Trichogramma pretiosum]XP_014230779.1 zinc finger BED domain-containing protein 1-like [Trichogramma pretiosum]